ncbi:hypothetical protein [Deminuibacter soli]|uniref:Uncharacterized protein n=1 Tax=Deminuibacter soli TaxID=2291815 RepID=A0A3E1NQ53_9BACT|nr:hypothetical protein [Deminuibacter soli]RFM30079.1 hypothetical protein DXN05_03650 [Deminuibacter soli]
MEFKTDELPIKIIHWEYYKSPKSITKTDMGMTIRHVLKPDTKIANGLLFRCFVKFYKEADLSLNCIAEQVFINDGIKSLNFLEIKSIMEKAFYNFNCVFQKEYKKYALGANLIYTVKDQEVHNLLGYLKNV